MKLKSTTKRRADPTSPEFKSEFYPFTHVSRTSIRYNHAMTAALRKIGLEQPEWRLLMVLAEYDGSSIGELVERTALKQSTLTRIVQRSVRDGLVKTVPQKTDQRIVEVHLTAKGRELTLRSRPVASSVYQRAVAALTDGDLEELIRLLIIVERSLGRSID